MLGLEFVFPNVVLPANLKQLGVYATACTLKTQGVFHCFTTHSPGCILQHRSGQTPKPVSQPRKITTPNNLQHRVFQGKPLDARLRMGKHDM